MLWTWLDASRIANSPLSQNPMLRVNGLAVRDDLAHILNSRCESSHPEGEPLVLLYEIAANLRIDLHR